MGSSQTQQEQRAAGDHHGHHHHHHGHHLGTLGTNSKFDLDVRLLWFFLRFHLASMANICFSLFGLSSDLQTQSRFSLCFSALSRLKSYSVLKFSVIFVMSSLVLESSSGRQCSSSEGRTKFNSHIQDNQKCHTWPQKPESRSTKREE